MRRTVPVIAMTLALVPAAWSQQAVSARAGLIQYVEGRVLLDDKQISPKVNEFPQMDKGQVLATEDGRVEILLTPGAFLRLSENSSFKLVSGSLDDTRLEVLSGSAMVEVEELLKDNAITLQSGSTQISLKKHGLYRVDAEGTSRFRVYDGEALVTAGEQTISAKKGREVELAPTLLTTKFDTDITDPFYRWSARRAGYVATANVSSARSVLGGVPGSFLASLGGWTYNPWFGMYTYVPWNGFGYSPFGYAIYSPVTVRYIVVTQPSYIGAVTQRTISPPSARSVAAERDGVALGRSAVGGSSVSGGGGIATSSSGGGGGSAIGRVSVSAPSAPAAAPAASMGGGARSAPAGGGARGR